MTCGIYLITNTVTGDRYVGQSKNIEHRVKAHGVSRYNGQNLTYKVLQECTESELNDLEWDWVLQLKPERNRTVPVLHPTKGKVWQNPGVVEAILKRKRKGLRSSHSINHPLLAGLKGVAILEDRNDTAQLERWIREGLERWRLENPSKSEELNDLIAGFLAGVEAEEAGEP